MHALHAVRAWAAQGYQPVYLSGRQVYCRHCCAACLSQSSIDESWHALARAPCALPPLHDSQSRDDLLVIPAVPQGSYYNLTLEW